MLELRIKRLERVILCLLLVLGSLLVAGWISQKPKTVEAERFFVTGKDGKARGLLSASDDGASFILWGKNDKSKIHLMAGEANSITISDSEGRNRFTAIVAGDNLTLVGSGFNQAAKQIYP